MKRYMWLSLIVLLISALMLSACGGGSTETSQEPQEDAKEPANEENPVTKEDNILRIGMGNDMVTFDIHDHNNTSTEAIHINIFSYLFKRDENMEIQPHLVESYENVDDTTWAFKLKEGVLFHNGDELTAEDVKFTLERVATDSSLQEHPNYNQIKEVRVIDDYNFEIITHNPEPALLNRLSRIGSGILPKKYIEENGWDHFLKEPVGSGPYKFVEWVRDDRLVLEPFEDYFEGKVDEWEQVIFRAIPETSTRVAELLTGGVDIAVNIPPADWERVNNNEGTSIISGDTNRVMLLMVRHNEGLPTADPRVREAIDLAINNEALTEHVLQGSGTPVRTRVTPGNVGAHPDLYNTYRYDPEKAKQLLEEAGYPNGFEITLNSPRGRYLLDAEVAEMVAGMLAEVGIKVNVDFMEWGNFVEAVNNHTLDELALIGYGNSLFDASLALVHFHSEVVWERNHYKNEEVDRLLEAAEQNMNAEERVEQYKRVQEIVAEDLPYIYLYQLKDNIGVSDAIDYTPRLDEMFYVPDIKKK